VVPLRTGISKRLEGTLDPVLKFQLPVPEHGHPEVKVQGLETEA